MKTIFNYTVRVHGVIQVLKAFQEQELLFYCGAQYRKCIQLKQTVCATDLALGLQAPRANATSGSSHLLLDYNRFQRETTRWQVPWIFLAGSWWIFAANTVSTTCHETVMYSKPSAHGIIGFKVIHYLLEIGLADCSPHYSSLEKRFPCSLICLVALATRYFAWASLSILETCSDERERK